MEIKILGGGCPKCKRLEHLARSVAEDLGVEATFSKVIAMEEIMTYDITSTPALVINGAVKSSGRMPQRDEVARWIREAAG
ncbi:MAG: thioredoxin family protein [Anaerolineae bacterium]|nr:thioredoxin family protein [Anaerolineae bacterium]